MRVKKWLAVSVVAMSMLPVLGNAMDVVIENKTSSYGTGKFESILCPCSGSVGGVAEPNGAITVPDGVTKLFCIVGRDCYAKVFVTKNCTGSPVVRVKMHRDNGVLSVENLDPAHYVVSGSGGRVEINEVPRGFLHWLKSWF
ncbi:MAG: hypothetical protein A3E83_00920 [Gammaproteobacteria bacterium RIFCSPHIGHO2_12_FULL_41_20]|nr:MAG: hypothetical protein A3E83_00920 [Gammaproteobacteria bacterium RIFCSPHIGHO2_12_FULL_41_20]